MHTARARLPCLPVQPFLTEEPCPGGVLTMWWEWRRPGADGR
jgi:hypothetical protein